jgi:ketosteroid isomerase-like protein
MSARSSVLLVSLMLASVPTVVAEDTTGNTDLTQTIAAFYAAIEGGDVEARIGLLADDVILMPNHWSMLQGKEAVSASFRSDPDAVFKLKDRRIVQMDVGDGLAYTANSYYYAYHGKDEPEQWHKTKNVHVWRRDAAGAWKLAVDIWNSDVPLEKSSEE